MYCGIFIFVLGKIIYRDKNVRIPKVMQILCTQYTQMKCIGYKFYCIFGKTVTQCPLIASLYLPVCAQVSYDSIASLILTFLGTPLEFPLIME